MGGSPEEVLVVTAVNAITYVGGYVSAPHIRVEEWNMPRTSPWSIVLSSEEREVLERRSRQYTLPYRDVVRARIILYAADGLENKEIGERLDLPREVASKWRKRFYRKRLAGLEEEARRGRPAVFSPARRL
jgi:hypothetical protein